MKVSPERWRQVASIYEQAVDRDPATREAFLAQACAGDEPLLREVRSLLSQDDAAVVLDRPVWATAAPLFQDEPGLGPGATLGPYRIDGRLGAGGMGDVFSATDTRLNRRVALKVLPAGLAIEQEVRARFAREAEAVAALTHPHICTLYDVGHHGGIDFLVMQYLEGETLAAHLAAGPLPCDLAFRYAKEIASALDHAHRNGIIHRDLKPANIMLTGSGAKLLDFGVAKFRAAGAGEPGVTRDTAATLVDQPGGESRAHATRGGTILGTVRYMSPEQITARGVDARSDLFSFGAVLFEMFTGRRAFEGETAAEVRAAILQHDLPAVSSFRKDAPPAVDAIVRRCLSRDRDQRWHSAGDVVRELELADPGRPAASGFWKWMAVTALAAVVALGAWLLTASLRRGAVTGPVGAIRSIAVLPLVETSGDPDLEVFAEGMTEQLIADLARTSGLRVISPTSVTHYKAAGKAPVAIAKELQVDGIVEGTVFHAHGRVHVSIRLIRGTSGDVVWSESFERDLGDVVVLQREMALAISRSVDVTVTQEPIGLPQARPVDPEVRRLVLLGRHHAAKASEEGLQKSIQYLELALARAPDTAMAHAALAETYIALSGYYMHPREAMPSAKAAALAAIRLDDSLAAAHAALGFIHLVFDWDGPAAKRELLRALELNPTLAMARLHYAAYLTTQAQHDAAVIEILRAVEFDPASKRTNALATSLLLFTRRYDEAIELARRGFEFEPNAFALAFQGVAYAEQRRFDEAVANLDRAARLDSSATILALQAHVLGVAGRKADALRVIQRVEASIQGRYFCPYEIATAHVSLGDPDAAYRWFRKGIDDRADCMAWLGVEPWIEPFRSDPRYQTLIDAIGLDPAARSRPATPR